MSNPKSFYNQPDYSGGSGSSGNRPSAPPSHVVHKPDEISSADLQPPPPYSPDIRKSSDSNTYGSTIHEQQQGLLGQPSYGNARTKPAPQSNQPTTPVYINQSSNPHQDYRPQEQDTLPVAWSSSNGDPGCCRNWCKYIFVAILIWLVFLKYGEYVFPHNGNNAPHGSTCPSSALTWDDMPRMIDFDRNVEVIVEGYVSGGNVVVTPLEDRHGGTIITDVTFTPSSLQKQMTYEVQQLSDTTRLVIRMPTKLDHNDEECINLNMEIRLPYSADLLRLKLHNSDVSVYPFVKDVRLVEIQTSNGNIRLDRWTGKQLKLTTSNGGIKVGRLIADESIYLSGSSGEIIMSENIEAKNRIDIQNSNGPVKALGGSIQADDTVKIDTSNGIIHLGSVLSDHVYLKTSNAGILADYIKSKVQVVSQTSNGPVAISVAGEKNNKITVTTAGSPVNFHVTKEFEGHFVMSTSNGAVTIDNEDEIEYQDNSDYLKRGERRGSGNKGDLSVTNSNADVNVSFDI
ncbi:unnamed protein product [Mucor hiemalis]